MPHVLPLSRVGHDYFIQGKERRQQGMGAGSVVSSSFPVTLCPVVWIQLTEDVTTLVWPGRALILCPPLVFPTKGCQVLSPAPQAHRGYLPPFSFLPSWMTPSLLLLAKAILPSIENSPHLVHVFLSLLLYFLFPAKA